MSSRSSIAGKLKDSLSTLLTGNSPYNTKVYSDNILTKLVFWDELRDYPAICIVPGTETREYHPGGFKWGFLNLSLKVYVYGENSLENLELLIQDIELAISSNERLEYETGKAVTEILISSITTDEGLLDPYGVGEVNLVVRYEI